MANLKLSPPWIIYYKEIQAFFNEDPDVRVIYDAENYEIKLYVEDSEKADALSQILIPEKDFGSIVLNITVIPANKNRIVVPSSKNVVATKASLFEAAFYNNGAVDFIRTIKGIFTNKITYVVFRNTVVQYFTDDLGDYHGVRSTLYQDIASEIFMNTDSIFFCTNVEYEEMLEFPW